MAIPCRSSAFHAYSLNVGWHRSAHTLTIAPWLQRSCNTPNDLQCEGTSCLPLDPRLSTMKADLTVVMPCTDAGSCWLLVHLSVVAALFLTSSTDARDISASADISASVATAVATDAIAAVGSCHPTCRCLACPATPGSVLYVSKLLAWCLPTLNVCRNLMHQHMLHWQL